jgi:clan AA aspartic protease
MITGTVRSNEAWVRLTLIGPRKKRRTVAAIVDTGYTSFLSLDSAVIADLGLIWETSGRAILADGSECDYDVYSGDVEWDGVVRRISIDAADAEPLVGMSLLDGFALTVQVREGGAVTIRPLPTTLS